MRGFIKFCGGLFVVAGMAVIAISIIAALIAVTRGFPAGIAFALAGLGSGASIALVGGGVFLLSIIDERMEALQGLARRLG